MSLGQEQKVEKEQQQVATRGKRPRVLVSLEDKERAISRIRNGETKASISRELGVPESTVRGWVKRAEQRLAKEADMLAAANGEDAINISTMSNGQSSSSHSTNSNKAASQQVADMKPSGSLKRNSTGITPMPKHICSASPPENHGDFYNDNSDHTACVLAWLKLFNDGLLNFTYIVSAAVIQNQFREDSGDPLWKIVEKYIEERGVFTCLEYSNLQNNWSNIVGPSLTNFQAAITLHPLVLSPPTISPNELPCATKSLAKATVTSSIIHPPPFHVTASDDDDDDDAINEIVNDNEEAQMSGNMDTD